MLKLKILGGGFLAVLLAVGITKITYRMIDGAPAHVHDFGAKGDGLSDDTNALQAALNTGKTVIAAPGDTYLVKGGLTQNTAGQFVDMRGATVKLMNSAPNTTLLTLSGVGASVLGGTWDMNVAGNPCTPGAGQYGIFAIQLGADHTTVDMAYVKNSCGIGIKGLLGTNYLAARHNRIENAQFIGILFDATTADTFGDRIEYNDVDVSATASASGIYIASVVPGTNYNRQYAIRGNRVLGALAAATGVGITCRAVDGIVSDNIVQGFTIGVSCDLQNDARNIVTRNQVRAVNGTSQLGVEVNGGSSIVSFNRIDGGKIGISDTNQTVAGYTSNYNQFISNLVTGWSQQGILVNPGTQTAEHLLIQGNTIQSTAATNPLVAIYLTNDCHYSKISDNLLDGPGSAQVGSTAVFLDTVNSDIEITGNRFSNWLRTASVFNAGAVAQTNVTFANNDVSTGIGNTSAAFLIVTGGSATFGSGVRIVNNSRGSNSVDDILDRQNNIVVQANNSFNVPNGNITAGVGSTYLSTASGFSFTKASGTGNTGWVGATNRGVVTLVAGAATVAVVSGTTQCLCSDTTAAAACKPSVSGTTLTLAGTGTDALAYQCFAN